MVASFDIPSMARPQARVLLVEDDDTIAALVEAVLGEQGYRVERLARGAGMLERVQADAPDLVLLDLGLPDIDGLALCRQLRRFSTVPLIMLTARDSPLDRRSGLDGGADDYICKPFDAGELLARLRALLRRSQRWQPAAAEPGLVIDAQSMQARVHGQPLELTPIEFRLLHAMARHPGRVWSRAQLLDAIYDAGHVVNDRTVDSHIKNLRRKLLAGGGPDPLDAVYGIGYRFQWPAG